MSARAAKGTLAATVAWLAGCQITPPIGSTTTVQVLSIPAQRSSLGGGYRDLHAALRAGVTRADVELGRLVLGECVEADPAGDGRQVPLTVTTLLPAGMAWPLATPVDVVTASGVTPDVDGVRPTRQHGRFLGPAPGVVGDALPRCRLEGAGPGVMRVALRLRVQAWQHDFAAAELARHDRFSDSDFAARSVVEVGCRVEALGDKDFMRMRWFVRRPPDMILATGDVIRLRAGASEDSKEAGPPAQILGPAARPAAKSIATPVACD